MVDNSNQGRGLKKKKQNQTTPLKKQQQNKIKKKQWQQQQNLEAWEGGKIPSALFLPIQLSTISSHGQDNKKKEKLQGSLGAALPHRMGEGQASSESESIRKVSGRFRRHWTVRDIQME